MEEDRLVTRALNRQRAPARELAAADDGYWRIEPAFDEGTESWTRHPSR